MNQDFQDLIDQVWEAGNKIAVSVKTNFQDELARIEKEIKKMAEEEKKKKETKIAADAADGFASGRIEQLELIIKNQSEEIDDLKTKVNILNRDKMGLNHRLSVINKSTEEISLLLSGIRFQANPIFDEPK